ncbi:MAG: LuxR family transcriptional regulator [Geminicoccaceae bacterium]|jgi:DNA-binding NarL/FixJ family response regulator|nr:LuxR family transcriptional regulator [Geminicoccaceae bacterium]
MIMRFSARRARSDSNDMEPRSLPPTRVVAVEDDARYRASLEVLLRHSTDFVLEESFATPDGALDRLAGSETVDPPPWDLVLMDLDMPGMSGVECTRHIKARLPAVPVVVLTVFEDRASIIEAICAGADGYLLKRTPADALLLQLRAVVAGGSPLSAAVARTVLDVVRHVNAGSLARASSAGEAVELTEREREVLGCLVKGMSYKAVAQALGISIDTVRTHIRGVYGKLQVHSVAEAVSRALRTGIV